MEQLIDSSVWVHHLRSSTPEPIRELAADAINSPAAVLCEPVAFELLRLCPRSQRKGIEARFATVPMLATPVELWRKATALGQQCRDAGFQPGFADLLITAICLHHGATIVTFDKDFLPLRKLVELKVELLIKPD
jgi:predicted nucleic acid-binding protein